MWSKPGGVKFKLTFEKVPENTYKSLENILEEEAVKVVPLDSYDIPEVPWFPRTEKDIRDSKSVIFTFSGWKYNECHWWNQQRSSIIQW